MMKLIKAKETAYRLCLGNERGNIVLADLRMFCNGTRSNFSKDALEMARMEGRREVFNRIMNYLKIDYDKYYEYEEEIFND